MGDAIQRGRLLCVEDRIALVDSKTGPKYVLLGEA